MEVLPIQVPIPPQTSALPLYRCACVGVRGKLILPLTIGVFFFSPRRRPCLKFKLFAQWAAGKVGQRTNQQSLQSRCNHKSASRTSQPWLSKIHEHPPGTYLPPGWSNCNWSENVVNSGIKICKLHLATFTT